MKITLRDFIFKTRSEVRTTPFTQLLNFAAFPLPPWHAAGKKASAKFKVYIVISTSKERNSVPIKFKKCTPSRSIFLVSD